jgi:hypothetical protein
LKTPGGVNLLQFRGRGNPVTRSRSKFTSRQQATSPAHADGVTPWRYRHPWPQRPGILAVRLGQAGRPWPYRHGQALGVVREKWLCRECEGVTECWSNGVLEMQIKNAMSLCSWPFPLLQYSSPGLPWPSGSGRQDRGALGTRAGFDEGLRLDSLPASSPPGSKPPGLGAASASPSTPLS